MAAPAVDAEENKRKMQAGELYYAFTPKLLEERNRCKMAQVLYNKSDGVGRREQIELYQDLTSDETPLPKKHHTSSQEEDEAQLEDFPVLIPPVIMDYGYNVKYV
ncbi:hypothetical protein M406DRAFT_325315 [Cryphonectria parasitica EP155]|uniref:Maltose/galactoside acetyltransferase domain-containing protein n=1 Tax=Cryphonectria parasitica (strain ATCC 38755 / EP155) TaxID=660469 RepID=A0A9P5CTM7_CRYP1|nr:uncharacterized protein M406DRAFT_325315 [Cryphonectria parasitica EP155]KAF3769832.1 hypothetical protein M406DRAFT_325315 [Cryphonectria parasitica EP155]